MSNNEHGSGLLLVMMDVDPEHEAEFNRWYDEEHLPERLRCPGFRSARRYLATEGSPKYVAIYELDDVEVLDSEDYRAIMPPSDWMRQVRPNIVSLTRNVYREITPDISDDFVVQASRTVGPTK